MVVNGWWKATREEMCLINVYAPCCRECKERLWDMLRLVVTQAIGVSVCLIRDFNSILDVGERAGTGWQISMREIAEFRDFVEMNNLHDLELQGRKCAWYRSNDKCKIRID